MYPQLESSHNFKICKILLDRFLIIHFGIGIVGSISRLVNEILNSQILSKPSVSRIFFMLGINSRHGKRQKAYECQADSTYVFNCNVVI